MLTDRNVDAVRTDSPIKTVLVPVDGSSVSQRAIGVAAWLASACGANLRLFKASFKLDIRDEVEELRALADERGLSQAQVEVSTGRSAAPSLVRESRRATDSVVVMATSGRSGLGAALLGSVADEVLRDIDEPIVLVGPEYEDRGAPTEIVVLWDGSLLSASVVPAAATWASELHLPVRLLHVREGSDPPLKIGIADAEGTLTTQVLSALFVGGPPIEVTDIVADDPARAILGLINDLPSVVVALATKGRGGITSSALGRVSAKVVQGSLHPVLAYHPRS